MAQRTRPKTDPSPLLAEWARALRRRNHRPATIRGYTVDLQQYFEWLEGRDPLEATERDVERFAEAMARSGLNPRSQARRLVAIRQFYQYLARTGRLPVDPSQWIEFPKLPKRSAVWLTADEVRALRGAIPDDQRGRRDAALIELGLCGLRVFEATGLDVGDVHTDRMQVHLIQKGGDEVFHQVTPDAMEALRTWLAVRPVVRSEAVFVPLPPRGRSPRLTERAVENLIHHYATVAGIRKRVTYHTLRHTVGQKLADEQYPLQDIQDYLRHKHPSTTRVYVERSVRRLDQIAREGLRFPKPAKHLHLN